MSYNKKNTNNDIIINNNIKKVLLKKLNFSKILYLFYNDIIVIALRKIMYIVQFSSRILLMFYTKFLFKFWLLSYSKCNSYLTNFSPITT